jgi:glycosyltransferase involved in cell wall biosynthesis
MTPRELTETSRPDLARGSSCVVIAAEDDPNLRACLASVLTHTGTDVPIVIAANAPVAALLDLLGDLQEADRPMFVATSPSEREGSGGLELTAAVDRVLSLLSPADVALLSEPCLVSTDWLEHLGAAARADTNTATASAFADSHTALALAVDDQSAKDLVELEGDVAENTMALRPRLGAIVGPCVYLRRDALELVGSLDCALGLRWALEFDLARRCMLSGLAHVAADDVVVGHLAQGHDTSGDPPQRLLELYPDLYEPSTAPDVDERAVPTRAPIPASAVLSRALEAARRPRKRLWVTIDARALSAALTGTQRHIFELIRALAGTDALRLRLVVSFDTSAANLELLASLPHTELLPFEAITADIPRSTVFHRPQQVFGPPDMRLALRLGERIVLNQLDLIAYRNPGYHVNQTAWRSHRRVSRQALAAADRVVVFSEHTRMELLSDELVDAERIRIVPPGLDHSSYGEGRRPTALAELPGFFSEEEKKKDTTGFLFCLGTDFRHKNRVFALRLLAALRERHGWSGRLVLAGTHIPHGSSLELEHDFLECHPQLREAVVELGAIGEEEKAWLMGHAAAVVYPSVYEGFGLVPFEAALSGVPCVFASQSSLAEVLPAETSAIVPWDPEESADRTYALLSDPVARAQHVETLVAEAHRLTWTDAAAAMLEVYDEAAVAPTREAATLSRDEVEREHELRELIAAQDALVATLAEERAHAQRMYHELNDEVGFGLSLIGPHGALPEDVQRALLALSARPTASRPLYGAIARVFRTARALGRTVRGGSHQT